uniref:Methyltransferase family protein n=1 Tax=Chenopodium quinoa TaxID=63459 RepID=A0A803MP72_CHEQI
MEEQHKEESANICMAEDEEVISEDHLGCPANFSGPYSSHFTFSLPLGDEFTRSRHGDHVKDESSSPEQTIDLDEDGDLIVWRAELVLADYVLYRMSSSSIFNGVVAVELGAGKADAGNLKNPYSLFHRILILSFSRLVGILIAHVAKTVFITNHGVEILDNCARNAHINSGLFGSESPVKVRELDWQKPWPPLDLDSGIRYSWTSSEVEEVNRASVLLAADVIYSDELTDAFFSVLQKMMCQHSKKVLYLALEKRYNFSLYDLDVVANGLFFLEKREREVGYQCLVPGPRLQSFHSLTTSPRGKLVVTRRDLDKLAAQINKNIEERLRALVNPRGEPSRLGNAPQLNPQPHLSQLHQASSRPQRQESCHSQPHQTPNSQQESRIPPRPASIPHRRAWLPPRPASIPPWPARIPPRSASISPRLAWVPPQHA